MELKIEDLMKAEMEFTLVMNSETFPGCSCEGAAYYDRLSATAVNYPTEVE